MVADRKAGRDVGGSDHPLVDFESLRKGGPESSQTRRAGPREVDFGRLAPQETGSRGPTAWEEAEPKGSSPKPAVPDTRQQAIPRPRKEESQEAHVEAHGVFSNLRPKRGPSREGKGGKSLRKDTGVRKAKARNE